MEIGDYMQVITLSGKKRAGKDTSGLYLKHALINTYGKKVELIALAEPMKDMVAKLLNITVEEVEYLKNAEVEYINYSGVNPLTVRNLLQNFGQGLKEYFGRDVWCELVEKKMTDDDTIYIITDVRFPFELDYFLKRYATNSIKIEKDQEYDEDSHESEQYIDDIKTQFIVENNGTLDMLEEHLKDILTVII